MGTRTSHFLTILLIQVVLLQLWMIMPPFSSSIHHDGHGVSVQHVSTSSLSLSQSVMVWAQDMDDDLWQEDVDMMQEDLSGEEGQEEMEDVEMHQETTTTTTEEVDKHSEEKQKEATRQTKFFNLPQQEHYYYEIMALCFIGACAVNYFMGTKRNEAIALEWGNAFTDLLTRNFSRTRRLGRVEMVRDSPCEFKMFATGRKNIRAMVCSLHLSRRQDLISQILGLVTPDMFDMNRSDTLVIEVALEENKVSPFVFAMFPTKDKATWMEDRGDLKQFATSYPADNVLSKYTVATDAMEMAGKRGILTGNVQRALSQCSKYFVDMHITDVLQFVINQPRTMRFTFRLPPEGRMGDMRPLLEMIFEISDHISSTKMSDRALEANVKVRQQLVDKRKKEAEEEKKEELKAPKKEKKSLVKQKQEARAAKKEKARREREEKMAKKSK